MRGQQQNTDLETQESRLPSHTSNGGSSHSRRIIHLQVKWKKDNLRMCRPHFGVGKMMKQTFLEAISGQVSENKMNKNSQYEFLKVK